jgi:hypothetical protein
MQFSWTMAGRKVKLELKKEQDPAAIICNVFDHILGQIERLKVRSQLLAFYLWFLKLIMH